MGCFGSKSNGDKEFMDKVNKERQDTIDELNKRHQGIDIGLLNNMDALHGNTQLLDLQNLGVVGYGSPQQPLACTMEVKLCPDGRTYVGRDSMNYCEFHPCPTTLTSIE